MSCFSLATGFGTAFATSDLPVNLQNSSFEDPDKHTDASSTESWEDVTQADVPYWNTTATDGLIELGWVAADGTSPHMSDSIVKPKAADGYCFVEVVADQANSSLYHTFDSVPGRSYTFKFSHRGRAADADTVALIFGPQQACSIDKTAAGGVDVFGQMVSWMKESTDITAPANGETVRYTLYSTELSSQGVFDTSVASSAFSATADENHTQAWEVLLCSSTYDKWNAFTGTYTAVSDESIMAFATFYSASSKATAGNLIDMVSLKEDGGAEVFSNSFEADISATYKSVAVGDAALGGWNTTATAKLIEIGCLKTSNAYGLPNEYASRVYIRDGYQFAELNANEESTLYQYVSTQSGKKYEWSLSHRGRSGIDTMALVIGPKQAYDPKKKTAASRDQLMQMVDWIKTQSDVVISGLEEEGCSQRITLYSAPFDDDGGFTSSDPFAWSKDAEHTERWCVWVISSDNNDWNDYGFADNSADLDYDYSYIVPDGSDESLFGFVSYEPAPKSSGVIDYSYGNLLDGIVFDEYYHVRGSTTVNGEGAIVADDVSKPFTVNSDYTGWALSGSAFRVVSTPTADRDFLGAIVNGTFVPVSEWTYNEVDGTYFYDVADVKSHYDIRLVFAAEHVIYDVNGGDPYHSDPDDPSTDYEVRLLPGDAYTSHAAASSNDGWRFSGWSYTDEANGSTVFAAEHTVGYSDVTDDLYINGKLYGTQDDKAINAIDASHGVTMVAQWRYRQRFATQVWDPVAGEYVFDSECGSITPTIDADGDVAEEDFLSEGTVVGTDRYVTDSNTNIDLVASPQGSYRFVGWYDASGSLVSSSRAYAYQVDNRQVTTLYARFMASGTDLSVTKQVTGDYADTGAYFKIAISVTGARANMAYKVTVPDSRQLTPLEGGYARSDSSLTTDDTGSGTATVYLKHNQVAAVHNLPDGATYSVAERDYVGLGYNTSYKVGETSVASVEDVSIDTDPAATVENQNYTYGLQVSKTAIDSLDAPETAAPQSGAGFTVYSDAACTKRTHTQQTTDDNGQASFVNFQPGRTYYLKETAFPTGYRPTQNPYTLKVKADGIYLAATTGDVKLDATADPSVFNVDVVNVGLDPLPTTGSLSTPERLHILGLSLLIAAAAAIVFRRLRTLPL